MEEHVETGNAPIEGTASTLIVSSPVDKSTIQKLIEGLKKPETGGLQPEEPLQSPHRPK